MQLLAPDHAMSNPCITMCFVLHHKCGCTNVIKTYFLPYLLCLHVSVRSNYYAAFTCRTVDLMTQRLWYVISSQEVSVLNAHFMQVKNHKMPVGRFKMPSSNKTFKIVVEMDAPMHHFMEQWMKSSGCLSLTHETACYARECCVWVRGSMLPKSRA